MADFECYHSDERCACSYFLFNMEDHRVYYADIFTCFFHLSLDRNFTSNLVLEFSVSSVSNCDINSFICQIFQSMSDTVISVGYNCGPISVYMCTCMLGVYQVYVQKSHGCVI